MSDVQINLSQPAAPIPNNMAPTVIAPSPLGTPLQKDPVVISTSDIRQQTTENMKKLSALTGNQYTI